jgi:hypothetical protein
LIRERRYFLAAQEPPPNISEEREGDCDSDCEARMIDVQKNTPPVLEK